MQRNDGKVPMEQIERNIGEIVRLDRERRGVAPVDAVISRFLTDEERQQKAARDTRRPMDRLLDQPLRRLAKPVETDSTPGDGVGTDVDSAKDG
ncbi:MAG TPA: hypothetical protein VGT61_03805 [Thermomicrobiales bacterium]|jgi:hypothetical protein|nr:hypothetical protein [Thermomicrobiales bacterium]